MKRPHLEQFLQRGMVMLHIDSRHPDVEVPAHLRGDAHLKLNLSYRFRPFDLQMDDERLRVTLSFGGQPHACVVPFSAVFSITSHVDGESLLWIEDAPAEVLASLVDSEDEPNAAQASKGISKAAAPASPGLRLVSAVAGSEIKQSEVQRDHGRNFVETPSARLAAATTQVSTADMHKQPSLQHKKQLGFLHLVKS